MTCHQPDRSSGREPGEPRPVATLRSRSRPSARRDRAPARSHRPSRPARRPVPRSSAATWAGSRLFQALHQRREPEQPVDRGDRRREIERAPRRRRRTAASSSSNSPSGLTVGRIAEPAADRCRRRSRAVRARRGASARRWSRRRAPADRRQRWKPGTSLPATSASASVGRKGAPGGMVKRRGAAAAVHDAPTASARATAASASGMASGVPTVIQLPVHAHAEQPAGGDRRVEIAVERERLRSARRRRCAGWMIAAPA